MTNPEEPNFSDDERMMANLVTSFATAAWVGLGKIKSPATDKVERNLSQASFAIDMLDMIARKMAGSLTPREKQFLERTVGDLKLNYLEESRRPDPSGSAAAAPAPAAS